MATLNEIVYDLWEIARPRISDDDNFDKRQFEFWVKNTRARFLRNELNKNRTIDDDVIQDLGCLELELADAADCCEITDGCKLLRTKDKIPNLIELHNRTAITRVAPINKIDIPFSFISYERAIWAGNGKYSANQIYAFLLNDRIYLKVKDSSMAKYITHINVRGVFEDPKEVAKFTHCSNSGEEGAPCYTDDSEYPIKAWMIGAMKAEIMQINLGMALQAVEDTTNNAKADNNESV